MLQKVPWQYQTTHTSTSSFKVGEIVFLKSNPEIPLTVNEINENEVIVVWFVETNLQQVNFRPEVILQYRYAGLLIYNEKFEICIN